MSEIIRVKEKLLAEIEVLPEQRLPEVLDFVAFLRHQEDVRLGTLATGPSRDPLLEYIGGIDHGSLARNIDQDLYES